MSDTEFKDALEDFLKAHGKTTEDLPSTPSKPTTSDQPVPKAVGEAVVKHVVSSSSTHRRRLRLFSGKTPVPSGEFDYESWKRPARQLVEDSNISSSEKLSRVIESLLPPASNIVWALGKEATAEECLDGLEKAYGVTADGDELYLRFSECFQRPVEAASEYLVRLQELLTRVQDTGGVNPDRVDNVRIQQFTRGCLYHEPLLMKLDLKKRPTPPNFVSLLQEVRLEEQREREKEERRVGEQKVATKRVAVAAEASPIPMDDVKQLQEAVALLQQQLAAVQTADHHHGIPANPGQQKSSWSRPHPHNRQVQKPRARHPLICFNCGQQGHRLTECANETNAPLVQQQMASRCKPASTSGNEGGRQ
ncbi:paraneoplastic antigen Ma3 homolog [Patiria miniata]|uniref:CCHC-type domain-containing protein n=1 Tax=Patiria miniata TaxID=46514 RepID=A0A914B9F7_PATMI|nr:paraneoplastic antigen Ma3 homolog [Patiria miniata]